MQGGRQVDRKKGKHCFPFFMPFTRVVTESGLEVNKTFFGL